MSERIDHSNYEAWLLDRLEGNLSPEQERALTAFLALHPHLDPGFEELPSVERDGFAMRTADKQALKRALPPTGLVHAGDVDEQLIARLEGDLGAEQLAALRVFLAAHPEHARAERTYAITKLVPEAMAYAAKGSLHRQLPPVGLPNAHTLDDFLVARMEGDLTSEQDRALEAYLQQSPAARKSWALTQATRVRASDVVYAHKASLKQEARVIAITSRTWVVRLAVAASLAFLLGMTWWWMRDAGPVERMARRERTPAVTTPLQDVKEQTEEPLDDPAQERIQPDDAPSSMAPVRIPAEREPSKERPAPVPDHEPSQAPIAEERPSRSSAPVKEPAPLPVPDQVEVPEPVFASVPPRTNSPAVDNAPNGNTLGQALAAVVRDRVLDAPADAAHVLDGSDAVAAVDKGLRSLAGDRAGLSVQRDANGRNRGFNLRLGRNLAISASR